MNSLIRRVVAALFVLVLMLVPVASGAQGVSPFGESTPAAPDATPVPLEPIAWSIVETRDIEVDGMPVVLSPDGQWIAGIGPDDTICAWAIDSLAPTCADPGEYKPNMEALVWSPDSTAIAFTEDAARMMIDSDLYVFEVGTGVLTNLTDDGVVGGLPFSAEERAELVTPVDLGAAWSPDSQSLMVGRMFWTSEEQEQSPEIVSIPRSGGEPTVVATLDTGNPWGVVHPMIGLDDGTLVYTISTADPENPNEGIWLLEPGGEPVQVLAGTLDDAFPYLRLMDAARTPEGLIVSAFSMSLASQGAGREPYAFLLNVDTGDLVEMPADTSPTRFGPDGLSTLSLAMEGTEGMLVITGPAGDEVSLGPVPRSRFEFTLGIEWASNNTVFLASGVFSGMLVTLGHAGS